MARLFERRRRDLRNATIAGAFAGFVAVLATLEGTRRALFWHSFLLETLLGALAGRLLARSGGGVLRGILLFGGSYLLAFLLRAIGLDPSVVFARGDLAGAGAVYGNFASLCLMVGVGAAVGHVVEG